MPSKVPKVTLAIVFNKFFDKLLSKDIMTYCKRTIYSDCLNIKYIFKKKKIYIYIYIKYIFFSYTHPRNLFSVGILPTNSHKMLVLLWSAKKNKYSLVITHCAEEELLTSFMCCCTIPHFYYQA